MFSVMVHRLVWKKFVYYILAIRLFLSLSADLTSHFSNFADFRQLQILNARTKYYEILPAHTKTPHDTTHKITNRYFEFKYHFSTLQKKFRLLLNKGVHLVCLSLLIQNIIPTVCFHLNLIFDNVSKLWFGWFWYITYKPNFFPNRRSFIAIAICLWWITRLMALNYLVQLFCTQKSRNDFKEFRLLLVPINIFTKINHLSRWFKMSYIRFVLFGKTYTSIHELKRKILRFLFVAIITQIYPILSKLSW